jgi:hypothetical protein
VVNSDPTRNISSIHPEVVVDEDAIAVAVSPDIISYSLSTWSASVPPAIPGIVAIHKLATLAIMFGPTRLVAIVPSAILTLSILPL